MILQEEEYVLGRSNMEILSANELAQQSKIKRLGVLKAKLSDDQILELNELLLEASSQGKNVLRIFTDHPFFSKYNSDVTMYLRELGYKVKDDYLDEDYDYVFVGYIIEW